MSTLERAAAAGRSARGDAQTQHAEAVALAVLRAIREPDERVMEAMRTAVAVRISCVGERRSGRCRFASCFCREDALAIWQAGIDKIAEEGK